MDDVTFQSREFTADYHLSRMLLPQLTVLSMDLKAHTELTHLSVHIHARNEESFIRSLSQSLIIDYTIYVIYLIFQLHVFSLVRIPNCSQLCGDHPHLSFLQVR